MRNKVVTIFLLVLASVFVFGQEELTLENAIQKGLENNFQIRITKKQIEIAENNNTWGTAGRYPSITIGANQANRLDNRESVFSEGRNDTKSNSIQPYVNLNWTVFNGFSVWLLKENYAQLEELSKGYAALSVENTLKGIILAYYKVLLEKDKLDVLQEVKQLSGDRYKYILSKKELGAAVTFDVLQQKNAFLDDSTNFLLQQINYKNSLRNLNLLLGEDERKSYSLTDTFNIQIEAFEFSALQQKMLTENTSLKNMFINQKVLENTVTLKKRSLYPRLSLNSGYDHFNNRIQIDDFSPSFNYSYDYYANLSLSFNLFNGGNARSDVLTAKLEKEIGELEVEELKIELSNTLATYLETYNARVELLSVSKENYETAKLNLQIAEEKFKSGAINSFNYRDIQLIYLNAAFGNVQAKFNIIDAYTELLRLTGGIVRE